MTVKDADGKVKTGAITDAGEYTVEVTSEAYKLSGTTSITLTINKIDLTTLKFGDKFVTKYGCQYLPLSEGACAADQLKLLYNTGFEAAADPETAFKDGKGWDYVTYLGTTKNTDIKLTLEKYDTKKAEWVTVAKTDGEGDYRVTVAAKTDKLAKNYEFATEDGTTVEFKVADTAKFVFRDVTPDGWYFDTVYAAKQAEYIFGVGNSDVFAPNASITRADVAVILSRMGGMPYNGQDEGWSTVLGSYTVPFSDVDGGAYYAKAVAWAAKLGIVTGYGDTGEFKPEQAITREEFATMLARYAEKVNGADITADAAALDGYADAANVSDWAKGYVAWAVEAKAMGQNTDVLSAGLDITRAEAATMAVRYQPSKNA